MLYNVCPRSLVHLYIATHFTYKMNKILGQTVMTLVDNYHFEGYSSWISYTHSFFISFCYCHSMKINMKMNIKYFWYIHGIDDDILLIILVHIFLSRCLFICLNLRRKKIFGNSKTTKFLGNIFFQFSFAE